MIPCLRKNLALGLLSGREKEVDSRSVASARFATSRCAVVVLVEIYWSCGWICGIVNVTAAAGCVQLPRSGLLIGIC
ncbi:unnamed protein product [Peniophora sp. CBMAI 1063]|nr:unnamed protein product [Peniophora sp. CBMAI 1063]